MEGLQASLVNSPSPDRPTYPLQLCGEQIVEACQFLQLHQRSSGPCRSYSASSRCHRCITTPSLPGVVPIATSADAAMLTSVLPAWIASEHITNPDEVDPGAAAHHDLSPDPATEKRLAERTRPGDVPATCSWRIIGHDHKLHLAVPIENA